MHQIVIYTHPSSCIVHTCIGFGLHIHPSSCITHTPMKFVLCTRPSRCSVHTCIKLYSTHILEVAFHTHPSSCNTHTSIKFVSCAPSSNQMDVCVYIKHTAQYTPHNKQRTTHTKLFYTHIHQVVLYTHTSMELYTTRNHQVVCSPVCLAGPVVSCQTIVWQYMSRRVSFWREMNENFLHIHEHTSMK